MSKELIVETDLRVRYAETDAMGIVYHTNYIVWFEVGRGEFFRQQGMDYADSEAQGIFFPLSEVHARYVAPAGYGDLVRVRTWVENVRSRSLTFRYEVVMAETGQVLVTGWTKHICTDGNGQAKRIPPKLRELLDG